MNIGSPIGAVLLPLASIALAGCAATAEPGAPSAAVADDAFARKDKVRLADALRRFDALGGKPLDGADSELGRWRAAVNQSPPMRGRSLGPGYRSGKLSAGRSEELEQVFLSGTRASVALSAPSGVRLRLEVQDRGEAAVCGKEGNPNHCQWVPLFTDRYRIRIVNPGRTEVRYFLVVG